MSLVRSGALEGYERQVKRLGGNPVELLTQVGLSPVQLRNPNTYISYSKMTELLELTADSCEEPCFGLLLAQQQNSSILGDLNMSVFRQPTVADALGTVKRYLYLHARGAHLHPVTQGEQTLWELTIDVSSPLGIAQTMQLSVGQLSNFIGELMGLAEPGISQLLQQPAPDPQRTRLPLKSLSRVQFGSATDGVRFPSRWLQARPRFDEERVSEHLRHYLATLQQRYPDNLRDQVKDIIGQLLPSGECSLEQVASTLDLQPRVLQLRLKREGSNYGQLLRETRQEVAEQHLRHGSLSVTDLALKLGFAETSVFSRSFKAWTGQSPREWQRRHR
jgi:AraC-like DNA-binding protein